MPSLRRLRRLRAAAPGSFRLPGLEGRAAAQDPGARTDRDGASWRPSPLQPGSRRRLALHARKRGRHIALGYKARGSWDLVEIEVCPIARPELVATLPALAALATPLFEHPKSAPTLHVALTLTGLDIDITGVEARSGGLSADARARIGEAAAASRRGAGDAGGGDPVPGAPPDRALRPGRRGSPPRRLPTGGGGGRGRHGRSSPLVALDGAQRIADLYCGAGAFTFRLAERASVLALDSSAPAVEALRSGHRLGAWSEADHRRGARPGPPSAPGPRDEAAGRARCSIRRSAGAYEQARELAALQSRPGRRRLLQSRRPSPATPACCWTPDFVWQPRAAGGSVPVVAPYGAGRPFRAVSMSEAGFQPAARPAFRADLRRHHWTLSAAKAAWWTAQRAGGKGGGASDL